MATQAWDLVSLNQMQDLARRDECLDIMVPSDLRYIVGRYALAVDALVNLERYLRDTPHHNAIEAAAARATIRNAGIEP